MELIYIVSIVVGSIFGLLVLICIALAAIREQKSENRMAAIRKMYAAPDLNKMEYDTAFYDDDIADMLFGNQPVEKQVTIEEVLTEKNTFNQTAQQESVFSKIDVEGLEEITGNYNPDD